jgi:hypothetical protein
MKKHGPKARPAAETNSAHMQIRVNPRLLVRLDEVRGSIPRATWVHRLISQALFPSRVIGLPPPESYVRLQWGHDLAASEPTEEKTE